MGARKKVILHVGLPKTGTTALQRWCYENRKLLASAGIEYPDLIEAKNDPKHQFIIRNIRSGNFEELQRTLDGCSRDMVVLSTEAITNQFMDLSDGELQRFRDAMAQHELIVFLVKRNPEKWLLSYYRQCVINPEVMDYPYATDLGLSEFAAIARVKFLASLPERIDLLQESLGAARVIVSDYESRWFEAFLALLEFQGPRHLPLRTNESVDSETVALVLAINQLHLSAGARGSLLCAIQAVRHFNSTIMQAYAELARSPADRREAQTALQRLVARGQIDWSLSRQLDQALVGPT